MCVALFPYPGVEWLPLSWCWIFGVSGTGDPPESSDGVFDRNKLPPSSETNVMGELIFVCHSFLVHFEFVFVRFGGLVVWGRIEQIWFGREKIRRFKPKITINNCVGIILIECWSQRFCFCSCVLCVLCEYHIIVLF